MAFSKTGVTVLAAGASRRFGAPVPLAGATPLDLGGREPAEIALAIMAEITAVCYGSPYPLTTMLESARKVEAEKKAKAHA